MFIAQLNLLTLLLRIITLFEHEHFDTCFGLNRSFVISLSNLLPQILVFMLGRWQTIELLLNSLVIWNLIFSVASCFSTTLGSIDNKRFTCSYCTYVQGNLISWKYIKKLLLPYLEVRLTIELWHTACDMMWL